MMTDATDGAKALMKSFVERIERLNEETKVLADDKRDVYAEAKSMGFHVKALKEVIKRRGKNPNEVAEEDVMVDTYLHALGMDTGTIARVRSGSLDEILHGTNDFPSDMINIEEDAA